MIGITVLDNGSQQDYVENFTNDLDFREALESGLLEVSRNQYNIGMSANILRSFEVAKSDWLWIVSDDDDIRPCAVDAVISSIKDQPDAIGLIRFRSNLTDSAVNIDTLEEFVEFNGASNRAFNGSIFLSNCVYRVEDFGPLLQVGYQYANTYIPHFMMAVAYMASGNSCALYREEVVDYVVPEVGYSYSMVAGLGVSAPKHALFKTTSRTYQKFLKMFHVHNDYKVLIDLFYICKRDATHYIYNDLAKSYVGYVAVARPFYKMALLRCFLIVTKFPSVFDRMILILEASSKVANKHVKEIKRRYS